MKPVYRPEIDGLRAIAVSIVILYHAQIYIFGHQPFKGGFIGVDIFFVISGYLITSIILKELLDTGTFSIKYFYQRRIRRILPALLLVMLVSAPFGWMYLMPDSFIDYSKSIIYSLGFGSNFYFHYSGQLYADDWALYKPFLHTWSLSVEEQYYIIFPLILFFTFKYFKKYLVHVLIFGLLSSLFFAEWTSKNYPSISFYFIHTRMWELLAGSTLAYFEITRGCRSRNRILNLILPLVGLILIGHSVLFFDDEMFHPSIFTISPIIGVCLIIWFSSKDEIITKLLSTKLFVGIGLISYSLYLWHYPIFAFSRVTEFVQADIINKLLVGIVILVLSIFSYFFVEKPARNKKYSFKSIFFTLAVFFTLIVTFNFSVLIKDGFKNRLPEIIKEIFTQQTWNLLKNENGEICHHNPKGCEFNISSDKKIYVIGDSNLASINFDLKEKLINKNYQFITFTFGGCVYLPGFDYVFRKSKKVHKNCNDEFFQVLKRKLLKEKNQIIILGGRFPVYLSNYLFDNQEGGVEGGGVKANKTKSHYVSKGKYSSIQNSFNKEVIELAKNNKIILIYPIPEVGWKPNRKMFIERKNKFTTNLDFANTSTSYKVYRDRTKSTFEMLNSIQGNNIYRVYPHKLFCNSYEKDRCVTYNNKENFYYDDDHPSIKGAEMINDIIINQVEIIELENK